MIEERNPEWSWISVDVLSRVVMLLKREGKWRYDGPRVRQVCRHWKATVDSICFHLTFRYLPSYPQRTALPELLREKNLTSFHGIPHYGRTFDLSWLRDTAETSRFTERGVFLSLCEVQFSNVENGDVVLTGMFALAPMLRKIDVNHFNVTTTGLETLSQFSHLTALHLRNVLNARSSSLEYRFLKSMTRLRHLSLEDCEGCTDVDGVSDLSALESFSFLGHAEKETLSSLSRLTALTALSFNLSNDTVDRAQFEICLERLRLLRVTGHALHKLDFLGLRSLESFSVWSSQSKRFLEGLEGQAVSGRCLIDYARRLPTLDWNRRTKGIFSRLLFSSTIKALEISFTSLSFDDLQLLSAFVHLRELRTHMCHVRSGRGVTSAGPSSFPSLRIWTVNATMYTFGYHAFISMPLLEHIGLRMFMDDDLFSNLSSLRLVEHLRQISFGVGYPMDDVDFRWDAFCETLDSCVSLKHIGWRSFTDASKRMPDDVVQHFQERDLLVDRDVDVFKSG